MPLFARLRVLAAPFILYELAHNQTRTTGENVEVVASAPLTLASPLLLPTLLSPPSSADWRRVSSEGPSVRSNAASSFFSQLPYVQQAVAAEAGEKEDKPVEKEKEKEEDKTEEKAPADKEDEKDAAEEEEKQPSEDAAVDAAVDEHRKRRPGEKFRDEYTPSPFMIETVDLVFELGDEYTQVSSNMTMWRVEGMPAVDLVFDGEDLELMALEVDGKVLKKAKTGEEGEQTEEKNTEQAQQQQQQGFEVLSDGHLMIRKSLLPAKDNVPFVVKTMVLIKPKSNLKLKGLYVSKDTLVTQCEAEGFRRITYYLDRPDVLARFRVRLEADQEKYPVLLSNGNKIEEGPIPDSTGRHFAVYEDPFLKPSYLFAILAGRLASIDGYFATKSGKNVKINLYSEKKSVPKLRWALDSVKKAMKWDEDEFGREYDLDEFNVGCVSDFNAGAMENKGLNIFNCSLLLADPKTTTDAEFERVLAVVGHEYFHNWTGNRVTLRVYVCLNTQCLH
ncbi:hypothetical protein Emed_002293 [Eimeria media]